MLRGAPHYLTWYPLHYLTWYPLYLHYWAPLFLDTVWCSAQAAQIQPVQVLFLLLRFQSTNPTIAGVLTDRSPF
jgi:hypothetical protein